MYESLRGATAILTRSTEDNVDLARRLAAGGARVIEMPCVRTEQLDDLSELAAAIASCASDDWLVVTSRAGADAVARAGRPRSRVAAVGSSTATRLRDLGIPVDLVPSVATGERLALELPTARAAVLARSDRALPEVAATLSRRGFVVREVVAYRTVPGARGDVGAAREALAAGGRVAIFCASPSAVEGLVGAIDTTLLERATFFVIGATTERAVRERVGARVRVAAMEEEATDVAHG